MNVYRITKEDGSVSFTAAASIPQVFHGKNNDFAAGVIKVEQIETGLSQAQAYLHTLPMDIVT